MASEVKIPPLKRSAPYPVLRVLNPGKGLNNLTSDNLIDDKEASDLNNIKFTEAGVPTKSDGTSTWGTGLANNPKGLGSFVTDSGNRYVCTIDGTNLVYNTSSGGAFTTVTGATFTPNVEVTFTQTKTTNGTAGVGALFIWNGTDGGAYWDGASNSSLSRPGTMPSAAFSIVYLGLHFAAGTSTNPSRLYIADPNQRTVFTNNTSPTDAYHSQPHDSSSVPGATVFNASAAALIDINPQDGDKITGLARFKDSLIVFKERSIYQITLDSSGNPIVTPVLNYLGAVSHKSIDNVDNDIFYLSRLGWFVLGYEQNFYNLIRSQELSVRIHPLIDTINAASLTKVVSIYKPYVFYSSFPSGGSSTNNLTVTYDKRYTAWSKIDYIHANSFTVLVDSGNAEHLLYAADDTNQIFEIVANQFSANGSAITSYWQSKSYDLGKPDLYKRWIDITLFFRQVTGTISVTVYADGNTVVHSSTISPGVQNGGIGLDQFGAAQFGDSPNATFTSSSDTTATTNVPYRIRISQKARSLKFKVSNGNMNETFVLLGHALAYREYSHFTFPSTLKVN